jgi:cobalamin biosynthesis protein CobD/CbiB
MGIVLASGAGALGVILGGPIRRLAASPISVRSSGWASPRMPSCCPSAIGLGWRALILWLLLMLLLTLANLAP